jgi:hypothetical protein
MELTIRTDLMAPRRVLTVSAAVLLPALAVHRAGEWLRSCRQAPTRPLRGAPGPRPASDRENGRALRISQARWKLLL